VQTVADRTTIANVEPSVTLVIIWTEYHKLMESPEVGRNFAVSDHSKFG
jgi:hypothetical protein